MSPANPRFGEFHKAIRSYLSQVADPVLAKQQALAVLQRQLMQQAALPTCPDNVRLLGFISLTCILRAFRMRAPRRGVPRR